MPLPTSSVKSQHGCKRELPDPTRTAKPNTWWPCSSPALLFWARLYCNGMGLGVNGSCVFIIIYFTLKKKRKNKTEEEVKYTF